jgi:ubiquitin-like 1-activating enzyme E1 A
MEKVVTKKSDDFLDISTAIKRLLSQPGRKRNPLIYFYLLLLKFVDQVSADSMDLTACKDYISRQLNELKFAYDVSLLDLFLKHYGTELSPVAAIIGGTVTQEVLKLLSSKELPIQSFFVYNASDQSNSIENPNKS